MRTERWRFRPGLLMAALMVVFALSLAVASGAQAYIYWTNQSTGSIGRANLDGTGVNQNFITAIPGPMGVAVDPGRYNYNDELVPVGTHIYWTDSYGIGRANLDGSGVDMKFIQSSQGPIGVAAFNSEVDSPTGWPVCWQEMLVWTEWAASEVSFARLPGCTNAGGPNVVEDWLQSPGDNVGRNGIAVGAMRSNWAQEDSGRVYWTALMGRSIGRTNLDPIQPAASFTESFITTSTNYNTSEGVAVRQEGYCPSWPTCGYIYWVNGTEINIDPGGSIGRANLDGSGVNQNFISLPPFYTPRGVAVDTARFDSGGGLITTGGHIYFTMPGANRIGRANLDGTAANLAFITGAAKPWGIAVDAGGPPPGVPQLTKVTQSATTWRLGTRLPRTARARRPVGTTFAFTLDRAARVRFLFTRRTVGRRVGGRCVAQTPTYRSRPRCLRTVRAAFTRQARAGRTRLGFQGRLTRKRKLAPGRYKLILTATANRRRSQPAILRFTILP